MLFDIFKRKTQDVPKNASQEPQNEEERLIKEYKKHEKKHNSDEYYAALSLVEYYYKLRENPHYQELCAEFCNCCINCLTAGDMQKNIQDGIRIPAFRHLISIHEKRQNYETAHRLCLEAIKYSQSRADELEYYTKKAEKLMAKL